MKVHFVCWGNYYRSRLAEAYLKSKQLPNIEISSSGLMSEYYFEDNGPISWYAMRLLKNSDLISFMKTLPTQTTEKLLDEQDLVVFMTENHLAYARNNFGFTSTNYLVWDIKDVDESPEYDEHDDMKKIEISEKTFAEIKKQVDELVTSIDLS